MIPCNRHLLVSKIVEEEEQENKILLPEDYKKTVPYIKARVLSISSGCKLDLLVGEVIVFRNGMEETIEIDNKKHYLLLENHVLCRFVEEEPK
tara:strand:+ start:54 stop:332 length:279 start_codon:yes stop_codon:yes gene_type:complete